jgi:hypothetical protein
MKNVIALFSLLCLFLASCHRPTAYFQPTVHSPATRLSVEKPVVAAASVSPDTILVADQAVDTISRFVAPTLASLSNKSVYSSNTRIHQRIQHTQSLLPPRSQTTDQQPEPKPKKKLKLGNQIRQSLGMKLRPELNWWQRISWKLKASVIVILVAVVFAILHVTILAIIFGIVGAFLMISGLKRSFKVRRPWF